MNVKTICVYKKRTNEVIACIPLQDGSAGILHENFDFNMYGETEPYFENVDGKVILKENTFGIKL